MSFKNSSFIITGFKELNHGKCTSGMMDIRLASCWLAVPTQLHIISNLEKKKRGMGTLLIP